MKYQYLAAVVYLCITSMMLSTPLKAEQISDHYYLHETSTLTVSGSSIKASDKASGQTAFKLLDTVWILGLAISGLVLLRKVQGE